EQEEGEVEEERGDDACPPQRQPQHQADKKQRNEAVEDGAIADRGELLVGKDDRSGEPHLDPALGREAERRRHFAYHRRCFGSGLQISEIEDRLYVHEAPKFRDLGWSAGDEFTPRESRSLALRQDFECIRERSESRFEIVQLCFAQAHALERLRQRTKDTAQRRIGGQRSEEGLGSDQVCGAVLHLVQTKQEDAITFEELAAIGTT